MIGLSQALFAYTVSKLFDLDSEFAVLGSLIPTFSLVLIYAGPLKYEGVFLSLTSAAVFSLITLQLFNSDKSQGLFAGYSCSLLLESLTFSYLPIFYPFYGFQGLGWFSSFDPAWNLSIISFSVLVLAGIKLKN